MHKFSLHEKRLALEKISEQISDCKICRRKTVGSPVPGEGNANAKIIFVGEAPGKDEAKTGRPFIGRAGKILRELIRNSGLKEKDVFITSALKYLPKHVTPKPAEIKHARQHLFDQIDIIQPKIIVLLGRIACLSVLEKKCSLAVEHGTLVEKNGRKFLIVYHPAAVLYSNAARKPLTEDFKKLKKLIKKL